MKLRPLRRLRLTLAFSVHCHHSVLLQHQWCRCWFQQPAPLQHSLHQLFRRFLLLSCDPALLQ
uniref:Uncharacterized protein n=1 Tax=Arundo donax TaxID=35708 RepID=A0A0A9EBA7_ARUDO